MMVWHIWRYVRVLDYMYMCIDYIVSQQYAIFSFSKNVYNCYELLLQTVHRLGM